MQRYLMATMIAGFTLSPAAGGLYLPGQTGDFVPRDGKVAALSFDQFRLKMSDVIGIGADLPVPTELRKQTLAKRDELQRRRLRLNADELNTLGGCYYRLNNVEAAYEAWLEATRRDPRNFQALSNLSFVKFIQGELDKARLYDSDAKFLQPKQLPRMSRQQSDWYLRVEGKMRELIRARLQVQRQGIMERQLPLDDLFGVQFVGESGRYEAGGIAAAQREKLPEDAIAIVQQLLLWMPRDNRLYWLLAELYNASGDPGSALTIMTECESDARRFHPELLRLHRYDLEEHFQALRDDEDRKERSKRQTFWGVSIAGGVFILALVVWQVGIYLRRLGQRGSA